LSINVEFFVPFNIQLTFISTLFDGVKQKDQTQAPNSVTTSLTPEIVFKI